MGSAQSVEPEQANTCGGNKVDSCGYSLPSASKSRGNVTNHKLPQTIAIAGAGIGGLTAAIALVAAALFWLIGRWLKTPGGSQWWQTRVLRLPLLGGLLRKYQLTLFARSLGTLLGNGVPLLTALRIATETVGNQTLRGPLERMVPQVKEGARVADAMRNTGIFEPLALNLMRVGEETGRIGPMMLELAQILNREVENGIKRALTMLEPLLILVLGVLIAAIIVSILLGILSVNDLAV